MLYIFDKDQTLEMPVLKKDGKTRPSNNASEQAFYSDVLPKTELLKAAGHVLAVASNQGGVAFGIMPGYVAEELVERAADFIGAEQYRMCPFHPKGKIEPFNRDSPNRKPAPGMLLDLMQELDYAPEQTVMVGDDESDFQAAEAAGCLFVYADAFFERSHQRMIYYWQGSAFDAEHAAVTPKRYTINHQALHWEDAKSAAPVEQVQVSIMGVDVPRQMLLVKTAGVKYSEFATISIDSARALGVA